MRRTAAVLALLLPLVAAGCTAPWEGRADDGGSGDGVASSAPDAPVIVELAVDDARAFFANGTNVTITVQGAPTASMRAGVALPDDVEVVDGELSYEGPLQADAPVVLQGVLRAEAPGEHVLRAWAESPMGVGSRAAPAALLAVVGDADDARFEERSLPAAAFGIRLTPSEDLRSVTATITGEFAANARVDWIVPEVFANEGRGGQDFTLAPGEPETREIEIGAAERWESGSYAIHAYLAPDAAVDGRIYGASLYYWWEGDTLRVATAAPDAPQPAGNTPP